MSESAGGIPTQPNSQSPTYKSRGLSHYAAI